VDVGIQILDMITHPAEEQLIVGRGGSCGMVLTNFLVLASEVEVLGKEFIRCLSVLQLEITESMD
jgi:hypothetical protein